MEKIKNDENLSEDEEKRAEKQLQEKVDEYNKNVEDHAKKKEEEIMTI
jgi:ribosome recycling factor